MAPLKSPGLADSKPSTVELPNGRTARIAMLDKVHTRIVECTYRGDEACDGHWGGFASHIKIELKGIHLSEKRLDENNGHYGFSNLILTKKRRELLTMLRLELHGQAIDLLTGECSKHTSVTPDKLQVVMVKCSACLPAQALLSLHYKSPLGGEWMVDKQPIDLNFGHEPKASSKSCVVM
jgi:hypothetical protein